MNDTRKNDSHEPGQACSFKPPQGGVITPILLMNDEGTVVKSLIPSQMANKGQHGFLSPPVWLPESISPHCALTALATAPVSSFTLSKTGSAQLCTYSLPFSPAWADPLGKSCASQTARQVIPLWNHLSSSVSSWSFLHTSATASNPVYNVLSHPLSQTANSSLLTCLATHTCTNTENGQDRWTLSRLRAPSGQ